MMARADGRVVVRAGPPPRSATTATGLLVVEMCILLSRGAFALENDGWNCTFECEVHVSAPGGARHGPRRERLTDFRRFSCP